MKTSMDIPIPDEGTSLLRVSYVKTSFKARLIGLGIRKGLSKEKDIYPNPIFYCVLCQDAFHSSD